VLELEVDDELSDASTEESVATVDEFKYVGAGDCRTRRATST
jgi:hypothetical protein